MSDIWERKIRTFFRRVDLDKDGTFTRAEFRRFANGIAEREKFHLQQRETLNKTFDDFFTYCTKASPTNSDVVTEDSLVESLKTQRDDPGFKKCLSDVDSAILGPMDVNHDGYLDPEEFRRPYENAGIVDSDFTKAAFDAIDVDHDGKLSYEEFDKAVIDYFCSDAESSTAIWGLL